MAKLPGDISQLWDGNFRRRFGPCNCSDSPLINPEPGKPFFSSLHSRSDLVQSKGPAGEGRGGSRDLGPVQQPLLPAQAVQPLLHPSGSPRSRESHPPPQHILGSSANVPSPQACLLLRLCPWLERDLSLGASGALGADHRSDTQMPLNRLLPACGSKPGAITPTDFLLCILLVHFFNSTPLFFFFWLVLNIS